MPETALAGTAHEAETAQLPQSISPVRCSVRQSGWFCGSVTEGETVATLRAPMPAVVAHAIDVETVAGGNSVDLEEDRLALIDADVGGESLNRRVARATHVPLARRVAGQLVLADDRVGVRRIARSWLLCGVAHDVQRRPRQRGKARYAKEPTRTRFPRQVAFEHRRFCWWAASTHRSTQNRVDLCVVATQLSKSVATVERKRSSSTNDRWAASYRRKMCGGSLGESDLQRRRQNSPPKNPDSASDRQCIDWRCLLSRERVSRDHQSTRLTGGRLLDHMTAGAAIFESRFG